jgi:hypothetical protein
MRQQRRLFRRARETRQGQQYPAQDRHSKAHASSKKQNEIVI